MFGFTIINTYTDKNIKPSIILNNMFGLNLPLHISAPEGIFGEVQTNLTKFLDDMWVFTRSDPANYVGNVGPGR